MTDKYYVILIIFLVFILFPVIFNIVELTNIEQFDDTVISNPQVNNKNVSKENIPYGIQSIQFLNNGMQPNQFAHSQQR